MGHKHSVYDTDTHFSINPTTRVIKNESPSKTTVIQHDHNSERFTFQLPRHIDGHDMSVCDKAEVHYINVDANATGQSADVYEMTDLQVSPDDTNVVICSWLISQNATKYAGSLNFIVRFVCLADDGTVEYAWHTAIFTGISVSSGILNDGEAIVTPYVDVLAQWKADLFGVGDTQEQRLLDVSAVQQEAIQAKGDAVLASIPEEYTSLQAQADANSRIKAVAIVQSAEGESIVVNDSADAPLLGLKIFGRSTQDGTPSPDAPVDIVSIDSLNLHIGSAQLLDFNPIVSFEVSQNYAVIKAANNPFKGGAGTYTFSCTGTIGTAYRLWVYDAERLVLNVYSDTTFDVTEEIAENATNVCVVIQGVTPGIAYNGTLYPVVNFGKESFPYEQFTEQTVSIPRALPGIPVTSGGNYTDADGQQWICDEVDLKRGVYVQRVNSMVLNGGETITQDSGYFKVHLGDVGIRNMHNLCSHYVSFVGGWDNIPGNTFQIIHDMLGVKDERFADLTAFKAYLTEQENAGKPVTLAYQLYTPIETPLSNAEITAFKAMRTNKPTTNILNDAGAFMAVEYAADTKTYIDHLVKGLMTNA